MTEHTATETRALIEQQLNSSLGQSMGMVYKHLRVERLRISQITAAELLGYNTRFYQRLEYGNGSNNVIKHIANLTLLLKYHFVTVLGLQDSTSRLTQGELGAALNSDLTQLAYKEACRTVSQVLNPYSSES
jgi:uncharacterized LabA/DUF88 family protein